MILHWRDRRDWAPTVGVALGKRLTRSVRGKLRSDSRDWYDPTTSDWFDCFLPARVATPTIDVLTKRIPAFFPLIRAYHACKPEFLDTYMEMGILPSNEERSRSDAKKLFGTLGAGIQDVETILDGRSFPHFEARVFLAMDDRLYEDWCGHYLVYGSEFLAGIAAELESISRVDYPSMLRKRGIPTVFVCDIPTIAVPPGTLRSLAGELLVGLAWFIRTGIGDAPKLDFTLALRDPVAAKQIVDHYHPSPLLDPLRGLAPFRPVRTLCDHCGRTPQEDSRRSIAPSTG